MTRRRRIGQKGHDHLPCGDESIGGFASLGYAQGEKHRIRIARLGRRGESRVGERRFEATAIRSGDFDDGDDGCHDELQATGEAAVP